ncbi:hypothetical protein [Polaromonas sp. P5_D5]
MTTRITAASRRVAKPRGRIVRALLRSIVAAGSARHRHVLPKRGDAQDDRDLDQRVRECGEW